jgi:hypothetical protein
VELEQRIGDLETDILIAPNKVRINELIEADVRNQDTISKQQ